MSLKSLALRAAYAAMTGVEIPGHRTSNSIVFAFEAAACDLSHRRAPRNAHIFMKKSTMSTAVRNSMATAPQFLGLCRKLVGGLLTLAAQAKTLNKISDVFFH